MNVHHARNFAVAVLLLLSAGCGPPPQQQQQPPTPPPAPPPAANDPMAAQIKDLEADIATLKDEIKILQEDKVYLSRREETMAAELRKQKFINEQQAKALKDLGDAAKERDFQKSRADRLATERDALSVQVAELKRLTEAFRKGASPGITPPAASHPAPTTSHAPVELPADQ